ncbi:hypothetical protein ACE38W_19130 [Chitinophaga sp. Hz27]|uniref:hypothetical protein n=1 Tax=Chitinophaga sp. Hz27 TaxID=3347169 RepID=UPI0035D97BDD
MSKEKSSSPVYSIPLKYRKMENLHIVFWLLKDIGWCMIWKPLGIAMIFPTLIISIVIAWRTRQYVAELCHNVAITLWITANSYWMISEFLHFDMLPLFGEYTYKHLALIPFFSGVLILAYYYLYYQPRHKEEEEAEIVEA